MQKKTKTKTKNFIEENLLKLSKNSESHGHGGPWPLSPSPPPSSAPEVQIQVNVAKNMGLLHFIGRGRSSAFLIPSDSKLKRIHSRRSVTERLEAALLLPALRQRLEVLPQVWLARTQGFLLL